MNTELGPLSGTLELPTEREIMAVTLIISGSGPTDRDGNTQGNAGKNDSLKMLAEDLSKLGIASLRYDKRLIGKSSSNTLSELDIRFDHYISDAEKWLDYLANRFDKPLYVIGHSEGSLIAIVAASRIAVSGLISISGAGRTASEILLEQLSERLPSQLISEAERVISSLNSGDITGSPPELSAIFRPSVQPYLISWFKYNPAHAISDLDIPTQIIQGTTDVQVSVEDARLLYKNAQYSRLDLIEGMNHICKQVSGDLDAQLPSYNDPSLRLAPDLIPTIASFITGK